MNRKDIFLIIGLMAAAIIGVLSLQMSFINKSRQEKEEQFDGHVASALQRVANRLEAAENLDLTNRVNGFSIQTVEADSLGNATITSLTDIHGFDAMQLKQAQFTLPIEDRINTIMLGRFLKEEMQEVGKGIPFSYGILSQATNQFVIYNNAHLVPNESQAAFQFLRDTKYRTHLFPTDINSPGDLLLYFPTKGTVIWGSLGLTLALSLLFVVVILGCFFYTLKVINDQKNLSEMKNDFINNMTHEFKTPIATISLASDSITNPSVISNEAKIKRFADIIRQENKRMHGQVEKVLQMATIERGRVQLNFSSVDLHQVIEQAVGNISLQVERKEGTAKMDLQATNAIIEADGNHISNVVNNLLDNANKYSPERPDILVSTRNVSNGVEITVSDKGIGMSKDAKKKIFEKFYRVPTGNRHDVKGFGLGLSYVKAMVTAHKGSVDVRSELGKGSSFVLFLPFSVGLVEAMHSD
jgi:two-component system, OmpR family, phosphate regulon sensor histidine kinase PhoR